MHVTAEITLIEQSIITLIEQSHFGITKSDKNNALELRKETLHILKTHSSIVISICMVPIYAWVL